MREISGLVLVTFFAVACVVASDEDADAVELEASESVHPAPPDDSVEELASAERVSEVIFPEHTPLPERPNIHLQPCFEEGAACNGGAVCTETQWGLYCMHSAEMRGD